MIANNIKFKYPTSIILLVISLFLFELSGCGSTDTSQPEDSTNINYVFTSLSTPKPTNVYNLLFQNAIQSEIDNLKSNRSPAKPLLIMDPYGTNSLSIYLYFESINDCYVEYRINAQIDGVATQEFTRKLTNLSKQHEFKLIGLVPGVLNEITLKLFNSSNVEIFTNTFSVNAPELTINTAIPGYPKKFSAERFGSPTEGLFITAGQRLANSNFLINSSLIIDNYGVVRGQFTIPSFYNPKVLFLNDKMIYACSFSEIAMVNNLGKVEKLFSTLPYTIHHDFILDENNILALVDGNGQTEDLIYKINMETGLGDILLNLRTFFAGYDFSKNNTDWLHTNALSVINEANGTKSLLISGREISAIMKVNDIYGVNRSPYIKYFLTDNAGLSPYIPKLQRENSIPGRLLIPNLGQHTITYAGPVNIENPVSSQYYIHFFNNNSIANNSGFDWSLYLSSDVLATVGNNPFAGPKSMFEMYKVDEDRGVYELVKSFDVSYSGVMGSSQIFNGNNIVGSANQFKIYEFDNNGNLLLKISFDNDEIANQPMVYRVFKYNI